MQMELNGQGIVREQDARGSRNVRRRLSTVIGAALAAALFCAAPVVSAQDVPWGKKKPAATQKDKPAAKKADPKQAPAAKQQPAPKAEKPKAQPAKKAAPAAEPAKDPAAKPAKKADKKPKAHLVTIEKEVPITAEAPAEAAPPPPKFDGESADLLNRFAETLAPHGTWSQDPTYGTVWVPAEAEVGKEFAPYRTAGRWAVTEDGDWAWVSDYKWGDVPFHYGRWIWNKDKKWAWIPDKDFAPAWVVWRVGDPGTEYVGWAPMAPMHFWVDGARMPSQGGVLPFWFVPARQLFSPQLQQHFVADPKLGEEIFAHSKIYPGHIARGAASFFDPATPKPEEARVPTQFFPRTRLKLDPEAMLQEVLAPPAPQAAEEPATQPAAAPADEEGRFATPPPPLEEGKGQKEDNKAQPSETPAEGAQAPTQTPRHELWGARQNRPRYRCWWTNTRPRIWRCGY
jgi:hypothetical protein